MHQLLRNGSAMALAAAALCLNLAAAHVTAADVVAKPNVVFLLADDLGWTGLRCFGSDLYETPHLDSLAASGVKFTRAYSACTVCSPTRAAIMTGRHPARLKLTDFIAGQNRPWAKMLVPPWTKRLEQRYVTVPEALKQAGYRTAHVGKWHLAPRGRDAADNQPVDHGFDVQALKPRQAKGFFLPKGFNAQGESKSDYLTDYLTDRAVQFIDKSKHKPFFLYFAYHTPHTPIQGRPDLVERFRRKVRGDAVHKNPHYAAMVHSLDQSVGRILLRLKQHGIEQRTVVIFTSDNGGLTQRYGKHDGFTENLPLRRGKGSAYEGGVRVPAIVRWPGVTRPGGVCKSPIISMDYYATLLEAAGVPVDQELKPDGTAILKALLRDPEANVTRNFYWHYPHYHAGGDGPYSAMLFPPWRLIEFHEDKRLELYDLEKDPGETNDLAARMPGQAEQLRKQLHSWRKQTGAQMPTPNPNYDPQRATQVRR